MFPMEPARSHLDVSVTHSPSATVPSLSLTTGQSGVMEVQPVRRLGFLFFAVPMELSLPLPLGLLYGC